MRRKSVGVIVCVSLLLVTVVFPLKWSGDVRADTRVGGFIYEDTWWTGTGSPYFVESDVVVLNGSTLYIETGVDVKFNGPYSIYVEVGGMVMIKEAANPQPYALFTSNQSTPTIGYWRAIQFNDTSIDKQSFIYDSVIEYATYGIYIDHASPKIGQTTIRYCEYGIYSNYGSPEIQNSSIEDCTKDGIHIVGNDMIGAPNLSYNMIINCSERGIVIYDSRDNKLRNNNMVNNTYNFGVWGNSLEEFTHDIDDSNTISITYPPVNWGPIYYWVNQQNGQIPVDAGYVGIVDSTNISVKNLTLTHNGQGVLFAYTNSSKIENVTAVDNELGVLLFSSSNNIIENSNTSDNDYNSYYPGASGIYLSSSLNNNIANSTASFNTGYGLCLYSSSINTVTNNTVSNDDYGIYLESSSNNNIITNNIVTSQNWDGIYLSSSSYNNITSNNVSDNRFGIYLESSNNNTIHYCNISDCGYGLYICGYSTNNTITNCTISVDLDWGIYITYSPYNSIKYCNISDTSFYTIHISFSSYTTVTNCNIFDNYRCGIHIEKSANNYLTNNTIWDCLYGLYVYGHQKQHYNHTIDISNTVNGKPVYYYFDMKDTTIQDLDAGHITVACSNNITLTNSSVINGDFIHLPLITNSTVKNCNISHSYKGIIRTHSVSNYPNIIKDNIIMSTHIGIQFYLATQSTKEKIVNNTILYSYANGMYLLYSSPIIDNNTIMYSGPSSSSVGIYMRASSPLIKNNTIKHINGRGIFAYPSLSIIENNTICWNSLNGIVLFESSATIRYNDIHNNTESGIVCAKYSDPTITYNYIEDNKYGIWSGEGSDPVINYNNICNNGGGAGGPGYGVYNVYSLITIDATNNWWGHASGPYHPTANPLGQGDNVSNYVNFKPYSIFPF